MEWGPTPCPSREGMGYFATHCEVAFNNKPRPKVRALVGNPLGSVFSSYPEKEMPPAHPLLGGAGVGSLSLQEKHPAHPLLGGTRGGFVVPTG
ncbi:MAG: hypothetical protein WKF89_06875, partial [Chitinophagaceae bacterium]